MITWSLPGAIARQRFQVIQRSSWRRGIFEAVGASLCSHFDGGIAAGIDRLRDLSCYRSHLHHCPLKAARHRVGANRLLLDGGLQRRAWRQFGGFRVTSV